ncbi:hypothetical protein BKA69DRAFT_839077 [Paraphysoderma sedebokerense]|nr:hypothetical protein BKA69DRAFT_839077 [Paraphysoderma sedebokerense]
MTLFFTITLPANGSINPSTNNNNRSLSLPSRQIRYTAKSYFFGRDFFQIKALDGFNTLSSTATIKISVPLIRDLHAEIVRPMIFPLCSNNRPCTNDSLVTIITLPRGTLKLLNGTDNYGIDSVPFSFPVDEAIRFEYIPPNELDYIKASMTYTLSTAEFDTTLMFYEGPLVSRDVRVRTNESTETLITLQCNFPLRNLLISYWLLPTTNSLKGNFVQFNSSLEFLNSQMRIRNGTRFRIRDDNGRMYFTADDNYSGIFEMQYFCTDGFGRISPPATLTVLVDPIIRCNSRTTIKNFVSLSNRDIARDGITFRILSTPEEGSLVRPATDNIPISAGESINATTLKYITNITSDRLFSMFPISEKLSPMRN